MLEDENKLFSWVWKQNYSQNWCDAQQTQQGLVKYLERGDGVTFPPHQMHGSVSELHHKINKLVIVKHDTAEKRQLAKALIHCSRQQRLFAFVTAC